MAQTIKVKPLIWSRDDFKGSSVAWWGKPEGGGHGSAFLIVERESVFLYSFNQTRYSTLEAAQAAAQADHERSMLAGIELVDEDPDETTDGERVLRSVVEPDLLKAAERVLRSWDERMSGGPERQITTTIAGGMGEHTFWTPASSSVTSGAMAGLRFAIAHAKAQEES